MFFYGARGREKKDGVLGGGELEVVSFVVRVNWNSNKIFLNSEFRARASISTLTRVQHFFSGHDGSQKNRHFS